MMLPYTYVSKGIFKLMEKPKSVLDHERDAIVKISLASICSSDLHIKHGSVLRAVSGITVGHEIVGIVEEVGSAVTHVKPGDRVPFADQGLNKIPDEVTDRQALLVGDVLATGYWATRYAKES